MLSFNIFWGCCQARARSARARRACSLRVLGSGSFFWWPGSPEFRWNQTKIKGSCTSVVSLAQNGQKQGWAPNGPYLGNGNFFWGGFNGKVVAPGIVVICPVDKNRDHYTENWLFATNIQIFGLKLHIIVLSGQLKPHRSMFSTRKRCLLASLIWGNQTKTT